MIDMLQLLVEIERALDVGRRQNAGDVRIVEQQRLERALFVKGMVVYPDRMRRNLELSGGVVFSGTILLELARRGVSREQAYEWVQRNAMRSFHEARDFKALLLADRDITAALPAADIERAFDLEEQLKHVDHIFERVFQEVAA